MSDEHEPVPDTEAREVARERHRKLAAGALVLPNLFLRSVATLTILYGMLGAVLIAIVYAGYLTPTLAVVLGVAVVILQFTLGPWLMDLFLPWIRALKWVEADELPPHLKAFVARVCSEHNMKFPWFGIISDGAPEAFTYGHHPNNARIVISTGLIAMLTEEELEGVVAHEIGHGKNWDMVLMTLANLVPLLLYYLYDLSLRYGTRMGDKARAPAWAIGIGAYILYLISQYVVLWFSRTREYNADRFAGRVTGNPTALASALVKIAYGLAAQGSEEEATDDKSKKTRRAAGSGPLGALNIFDRSAAVGLVMAGGGPNGSAPERVKGAMQWDLWNPWALYFELHSTHPLTAKRLLALSDQAAALGQEPYVVFDRKKPESYWDEFFVDLGVMALPIVGLLIGIAIAVAALIGGNKAMLPILGVPLILWGLGLLLKYFRVYPRSGFENLTVEALVQRVKVSPVRPIPTILHGKIIGKGVPGLVWSEDFVLRDSTGIMFLDYQQPLWIWNFLFGLLRAGSFQDREVRVWGWFRRAPVPYLEIDRLEIVGDGRGPRRCYTSWMSLAGAVALIGLGIVLAAVLALAM